MFNSLFLLLLFLTSKNATYYYFHPSLSISNFSFFVLVMTNRKWSNPFLRYPNTISLLSQVPILREYLTLLFSEREREWVVSLTLRVVFIWICNLYHIYLSPYTLIMYVFVFASYILFVVVCQGWLVWNVCNVFTLNQVCLTLQ